MAIIRIHELTGYTVRFRGLPEIWFGTREAAIAAIASQWRYVVNP